MSDPKIIAELNRLAEAHGGLLRPEDVVVSARSEDSPMHGEFDWEDSVAAQNWRVHQASALIRVTVGFSAELRENVRLFVSLTPDRQAAGGGYRTLASVLSDVERRRQMVEDALTELRTFEKKYKNLLELAGVFGAIKKATKKLAHAGG